MTTYFGYLFKKVADAWKEDKFMFFAGAWLVTLFLGPICLIFNMTPYIDKTDFNLSSVVFSPLGIIGLILTGYTLCFTVILMIPEWGTYLSWTWEIIKSPYTISKWIYYTIQDSYYNYKVSQGWNERCCFTCNHNEGCERTHPATLTCDGYIATSTQQETEENKI